MKVSYNSPVILSFTIISFISLILGFITNGLTTELFFSVYKSSLINPFTYVRFLGHVLGHANLSHYVGNITLLLILGPLLEEKYGSADIVLIILVTAIVTGVVNYIFFPSTMLLGASGVVFAFILLSSITCIQDGRIPLTFILVAIIYLGGEIYNGLFLKDEVSNLTHILGGIIGAGMGYFLTKNKV